MKKAKKPARESNYLVYLPRFDHPDGTMEVLVEDKVLEAMNEPGLLWVDFVEKARSIEHAVNRPFFFHTQGKKGALELMAFIQVQESGPTTFISFDVRE
ncbi:MAG: hypothetical protein QN161_12285 [Armatimonadota bacterium]|nr:hypothetical protein [Armatimonadota bacterium]